MYVCVCVVLFMHLLIKLDGLVHTEAMQSPSQLTIPTDTFFCSTYVSAPFFGKFGAQIHIWMPTGKYCMHVIDSGAKLTDAKVT